MRVFVSYSRTDFYLAEELALALRRRGVDAWLDALELAPGDDWEARIGEALAGADRFLLVASRQALASEHVRGELARALERGLPMVVARAGRASLPPELTPAPRIDVRHRFARRVDALAAALRGEPVRRTRRGLPAAPLLMPLALLLPALVCAAGCLALLSEVGDQPVMATFGVFDGVGALVCAWLAWEFVRRRPRRTVLLLLALAAPPALGAGMACAALVIALVTGNDAAFIAAGVLAVVTALAAVPLCWAVRSGAVYRWMPTGDAPRWLRLRRLGRYGHGRRRGRSSGTPTTYALHCHELDATVAAELEAALRQCGHAAAPDADAARQICVVSNLTPAAWLARTLARLRPGSVLVIAAPVPAAALREVERYQWLDHRRRRPGTLAEFAATLGGGRGVNPELVPEALGSRVAPAWVLTLSGMYALAALQSFGLAVSRVAGRDPFGGAEGRPPAMLPSLPLLALSVALPVTLSLVLMTRRVPPARFLGLLAASVATTIGLTFQQHTKLPGVAVALEVGTTVVLLALAWRSLVRWLPPRAVPRRVDRVAAGNSRPWRSAGAHRIAIATVAASAVFLLSATLASPPSSAGESSGTVTQTAYDPAAGEREAFADWYAAASKTGAQRTQVLRALHRAATTTRPAQAVARFRRTLGLADDYVRAVRALPAGAATLADVDDDLDRCATSLYRAVVLTQRYRWSGHPRDYAAAQRAASASDAAAARAVQATEAHRGRLGIA